MTSFEHVSSIVFHGIGEQHTGSTRRVCAVGRLAEMLVHLLGDVLPAYVAHDGAARTSHLVAALHLEEVNFALLVGTHAKSCLCHGFLYTQPSVCDVFLLHFIALERHVLFLAALLARLFCAHGAGHDKACILRELCLVLAMETCHEIYFGRFDGILEALLLVLLIDFV